MKVMKATKYERGFVVEVATYEVGKDFHPARADFVSEQDEFHAAQVAAIVETGVNPWMS